MLRDEGCLICGKGADQVPVGVYAEYPGEGARQGERVWLCEECAQVRDYARAFVVQVRDHYAVSGGDRAAERGGPGHIYGYSYRIASAVLRAQVDEHGANRFHAWTVDI